MKRWLCFKTSKLLLWLSTKKRACEFTGRMVFVISAYALRKKGEKL